jgi:copper homeostasis protein
MTSGRRGLDDREPQGEAPHDFMKRIVKPILLEVIVQTVDDARAAEAGGADRLEVVRDINRDGLTPSIDVVRSIQAATRLPLRVMVRESATFTVSYATELAVLHRGAAQFAALGVDGLVLGFTRGHDVDLQATGAVLADLPAVAVTFHRAFDCVLDPIAGLEALRRIPQIDRVLTSGGDGDWATRCAALRRYADRASGLTLVAGGGVDEPALKLIAATACVREVHVGRAARDPQNRDAPVSADRVRRLRETLDGC